MTDSLLQGFLHLVTLRPDNTISISPCLDYILPCSKFKKKRFFVASSVSQNQSVSISANGLFQTLGATVFAPLAEVSEQISLCRKGPVFFFCFFWPKHLLSGIGGFNPAGSLWLQHSVAFGSRLKTCSIGIPFLFASADVWDRFFFTSADMSQASV